MHLLLMALVLLNALALSSDLARAEEKPVDTPTTLPPVTVTGEDLRYKTVPRTQVTADPAALPAPTTILRSEYLEQVPITTYGDVFRNLPGINVNNFGQGGVGYGIAMRGFTDQEHGRDAAYFIDGVPLNEVSSIHTPNYADLNILIPETVERVEIIRGPFSALYGDSNLGGAVNIITKRYEPYASLGAAGGSFTTSRGIATYGRAREDGGWLKPFLAYEGYNTDGYRNNQGFKHYDLFNKASLPTNDGDLSIRAQFYGGDWGAPSYIRRDLVQSGALSPKAALNSSDGGNKDLQNVVLNYDLGEQDQAFSATGFLNHDIFNRFADFGGGQRLQEENRTLYGLTLRKAWTGPILNALPAQLLIGLNWRNDSVHAHQFPTLNRVPNGAEVKHLDYNEHGLGEYAQAQIKPWSWLKVTAGGRYDHFWYDIDDRLATMSVPKSDTGVFSPKAGVAVTPVSWLEVFANYGEGFRSPSAVDDLLTTSNLKPFKLRSQEVGFQVQPNKRMRFLADVWSTTINNEIFQPAPGLPVQNLGRSRREGYDIEGRYYVLLDPQRELSVFANFTQIRAVLRDRGPSEFVPSVPASILNVGMDFNIPVGDQNTLHRFLGSVSAQLVGRKHLTEDGAITTNPYERLAARLAYRYRNEWEFFVDAIWYPTDRLSETAFNLGPPVGASLSDIVVNPQAPVTMLVGLSYRFKTS